MYLRNLSLTFDGQFAAWLNNEVCIFFKNHVASEWYQRYVNTLDNSNVLTLQSLLIVLSLKLE